MGHTFLSHSLSELEKFREITVCVIHVQCCLWHFDEFFVLFLFQESSDQDKSHII